jgi:hypothetical protein
MDPTFRPGTLADAEACGTICNEAFTVIVEAHHFSPDFPQPAMTLMSRGLYQKPAGAFLLSCTKHVRTEGRGAGFPIKHESNISVRVRRLIAPSHG